MKTTIENKTPVVSCHVFYAGIYPVHFHRNLCGDVFELVTLENATVFASEEEAARAATKVGIQQYSIQEVRA